MTTLRHPSAGGFTLVEILVTVTIVATLASVGLPLAELAVKRNKEQELRFALREIRAAIDAYKQAADQGRIVVGADRSGYPASLEELVRGVEDARSKDGARIHFLRRLPADPMSANPGRPAAATWGKRSYASAPDAPREGDDVFDVYSRSPDLGLNGVAYRDW